MSLFRSSLNDYPGLNLANDMRRYFDYHGPMKPGTRLIKVFLSFTAIVLLAFGCKTSAPTNTEPVLKNSKAPVAFGYVKGDLLQLPCYLAFNAEIFGERVPGDVHSQGFRESRELIEHLSSGKLDAACLDLGEAVAAFAKGEAKIRLVAQVSTEGGALVVHDGETKTPIELAGKYIAVPKRGSIHDFLLHRYLVPHKLDGQIYVIEEKPQNMYERLHARSIDGFFAPEPYVAQAIANENTGIMALSKDVYPGLPSCCLAAADSTVALS